MYFPGDPLFPLDPIYQSIPDPAARDRLVATYDHDLTRHEWATGYRWDIVLTGSHRTWTEPRRRAVSRLPPTPGQTVGPFFGYALPYPARATSWSTPEHAWRSPTPRAGHGRRREAGSGCADRDLAGRPVRHGAAAARAHCNATVPSPDGAGQRPTPRGATGSAPSSRDHRAGPSAAFFAVTVFARGLLDRLFTRAYLPTTSGAGRRPVAGRTRRRTAERRCSRSASPTAGCASTSVLQGDGETVFLAFSTGRRQRCLTSAC